MPEYAAALPEPGVSESLSDGRRAAAPAEPGLLNVLGLLWRRKGLIASTVALTTLAAVLIVFQLTPLYTAETQLLFGTRAEKVVDIQNVLETLRSDRATIKSEVEVLRSRSLAEKVVDELGLVDRPEFNRHLRPPSLFDLREWLPRSLQWLPLSLRTALVGAGPEAPVTPEEAERGIRSDVVTAFQEATTVEVVTVSRVVSIATTSEDSGLAAILANKLADLYLREQLEEKRDAVQRASGWLDGRVQELREQVEQSEREVEDFRQQQGLVQARDTTLFEQQIYEVNTRLIAAQTKTAEADAELREARVLMDAEGGISSASEVLTAPLIQNLRMQEARLAGEAAQMASEYGELHPKMINVKAELADIRANIAVEVERILRGLENSLRVAQTRERTLEQSLAELQAEAARLAAAQARLRVLERDAAANQDLYNVFLARWKETGQQGDLHHADARIISRATVPSEPSWPNRPAAAALSLVVSVVLALLLVFLVEQILDRGFRDADRIEQLLGISTLAALPLLSGSRDAHFESLLDQPMSPTAESIRMLHAGLLLADAGGAAPASILITSALPTEGKTFLALGLAHLVARSGRKVLLIDADLRQGQIGKRLGLSHQHGLTDLLTGQLESVDEAIQYDERTSLYVMTAGRASRAASNILDAGTMRQLIDALKPAYELIVVDSPPAMLVSDGRTLARLMDKTVLVVRWGATPRRVVVDAFQQLSESGARITGAVLNMVKARRNPQYAYYGPGSHGWYGKYSQYYTR